MLTINEDSRGYGQKTEVEGFQGQMPGNFNYPFSGQKEIDEKLLDIIGKDHGFFVEIGPGDGIRTSRTGFLENHGWQGILIEPDIELCARCIINRPKSAVLNYCCRESDHPEDTMDCESASNQGSFKPGKSNSRTLTSIFDEFQLEKIDLLVFNTGVEHALNSLKGLDFNRFNPEYILINELLNDDVLQCLHDCCYELYFKMTCSEAYQGLVLYRSINNHQNIVFNLNMPARHTACIDKPPVHKIKNAVIDNPFNMQENVKGKAESADEPFWHRLSDLKVILIERNGTVKIVPINESPNYLCLLKLGTPEFDEIYNEYEQRHLLLNKNYQMKGSSYYLELVEGIKSGYDFKKPKIQVSNNLVWEGHHRICILYYLYGPESKLGPDFLESKKVNLVISTSKGRKININEESVIVQDFIMPEFVPGFTSINNWIEAGIRGFKEWYQPVDFGNGIVAHVTVPPDWKPAPEWDQYRGLAKWKYIVERHIPDVSGKRILDLGCNNGIISLELAKKGASEVIGIDRDENIKQRTFDCLPEQNIIAQANFVKKAVEIVGGVDYPVSYIASDISRLAELSLGKFDLILALCVVYHELDGTPNLIRQLSNMTDHIILQANLGHTGELGEWAHPSRLARLLMNEGFTNIKIDAPNGYIFPIVVGRR